jgi:predicted dithiol-disulfide oxidoreductase (DUF899 family)
MTDLQKAEQELYELTQKVATLRKATPPTPVQNYSFQTPEGKVTLLDLFAGKETLFLIHNMGQGCRYCTLWADGLNGFVPHVESTFAFALVSKDDPATQRQFANSRGWRFRMASHGGGKYLEEQSVEPGKGNMPGMVCYVRRGDQIFRKNVAVFGPGDEFCSIWNLISLAGISTEEWTPQFNYWKRPEKLEDGGQNLN